MATGRQGREGSTRGAGTIMFADGVHGGIRSRGGHGCRTRRTLSTKQRCAWHYRHERRGLDSNQSWACTRQANSLLPLTTRLPLQLRREESNPSRPREQRGAQPSGATGKSAVIQTRASYLRRDRRAHSGRRHVRPGCQRSWRHAWRRSSGRGTRTPMRSVRDC